MADSADENVPLIALSGDPRRESIPEAFGGLGKHANEPGVAPRVFISYSHDSILHERRVLTLAQRLRQEGVDAWIDRFDDPPAEGWPRWMQHQLTEAAYVLVVCSATYRCRFEGDEEPGEGQGANWEGYLTQQMLYNDDARNLRYLPILFQGAGQRDVPLVLQSTDHYRMPADYDRLLRRLSNQPAVRPNPVGELRQMVGEALEEDLELGELRDLRKALILEGRDTQDVEGRILVRRRQLRECDDIGPGTRLGDNRFELVARIGVGGFATVWKAYDSLMSRVVAVKILHPQFREDRSRRDRFLRGAIRMASLEHPGIVRVVLEKGEQSTSTYFVMEYLSGGDLRTHVCEHRWEKERAIPTLIKIGEALSHAHACGLVHRDVKPANILLDENIQPKLTDFDLVYAADTTGGTRTGALGTFIFAAPESLSDGSKVTPQADLFSLGMVGVFMLHGHLLPPEALRDSARFIEDLACSEATKYALKTACAWDPNERFASVQEFLSTLQLENTKSVNFAFPMSPTQDLAATDFGNSTRESPSNGQASRSAGVTESPHQHWLRFHGHEFALQKGETAIGRSASCQLVVDDPLVSRRHAVFVLEDDCVKLRDLGSANGVFVNGRRITEIFTLLAGDQILLGSEELKYFSTSRSAPTTQLAARSRRSAATLTAGSEPTYSSPQGSARVESADSKATLARDALELLGSVANKVLSLGRGAEAERILEHVLDSILSRAQGEDSVAPQLAAQAADFAVRLAETTGRARWIAYPFELYLALGRVVPGAVVDSLRTVCINPPCMDLTLLRSYLEMLRPTEGQMDASDRQLVQSIEEFVLANERSTSSSPCSTTSGESA